MTDYAQMWNEVHSYEYQVAHERCVAASFRSDAAAVSQEVARLEREQRDIEDFRCRVLSDRGEAISKLESKQREASKIAGISNVCMASELAERLIGKALPEARSSVERTYSSAMDKVQRALNDILRELDDARRRQSWLEGQAASHESNALRYDGYAQSRRNDIYQAQQREAQ